MSVSDAIIERFQTVQINNVASDSLAVQYGVPQSTVLSPLLKC